MAAWAGVQQANNTPHYGQGAEGYGKRLGAGFADAITGNLFGNAILPSLLHQDPRYFYQGTGTKWSRARHAMWAPLVCKGDNGKSQPNYSTWGGRLISSSISTAYYPGANRGAGHVFRRLGLAWPCMSAAVSPRNLSSTNLPAEVSIDLRASQRQSLVAPKVRRQYLRTLF